MEYIYNDHLRYGPIITHERYVTTIPKPPSPLSHESDIVSQSDDYVTPKYWNCWGYGCHERVYDHNIPFCLMCAEKYLPADLL